MPGSGDTPDPTGMTAAQGREGKGRGGKGGKEKGEGGKRGDGMQEGS